MTMPPALLSAARDLLRQPETDSAYDARLEAAFQRALADFIRETDFFAFLQKIPTVAGQSVYVTLNGTSRILAVFHRSTLRLVPSRSLDLLALWDPVPPQPEMWSMDKIPNAPTTEQFTVYPAPTQSESGDGGLTVLRLGPPLSDNPPLQFYPYLLFKTLAMFCLEDTEERDLLAGNFWDALAGIWREVLEA
jgi:hypothetical protein